jgi:acyl-CoA dehydrogenase
MEVLARYGNEEQKRKWLQPLLDGKIRSAFLMTERKVASSDAKNISMSMKRVGNDYVLNGSVSAQNISLGGKLLIDTEMVE